LLKNGEHKKEFKRGAAISHLFSKGNKKITGHHRDVEFPGET